MATAIGLTVGLDMLGRYYTDTRLTDIAGFVTALGVFCYITLMELVSILENFAEIMPEASWARKIISRIKNYENERNDKNDK